MMPSPPIRPPKRHQPLAPNLDRHRPRLRRLVRLAHIARAILVNNPRSARSALKEHPRLGPNPSARPLRLILFEPAAALNSP